MKIRFAFLMGLLIFSFPIFSQTVNWAKIGKKSSDSNGAYSEAICLDNNNNVIQVGRFYCNTTDRIVFDTEQISGFQTGAFIQHGYIVKYNNDGVVQWLRRIGNDAGHHIPRGVTSDNSGNIYVSGEFNQTCRFGCTNTGTCSGGTAITSLGGYDGFIAKYNSDGTFLWVKLMRGTGSIYANFTKYCATSNAIYVNGRFGGTAAFGEGTAQVNLTASGTDAFLAKYDLNGNLIWVRQGLCPQWAYALPLEVDASGNVYMGGYFNQQIQFASTTLTATVTSPYVVKYNASGTLQWARTYTSTATSYLDALAVDNSGNVFIGGFFSGQITFGASTFTSDHGNNICYLTKLNSSGNVVWAKKTGTRTSSDGFSNISSLAVNSQGDVYGFGQYYYPVTFDGVLLDNYGSTSYYSVFKGVWDTDGNLICIRKACGGNTSDYSEDMTVDADGVAYYASHTWGVEPNTCLWGTQTVAPRRSVTLTAKMTWGGSGATAGPISGPTLICTSQSGVVYSVPNIIGATFTWTVPSGATIASGQGTNSITVNFGTNGGQVCVSAMQGGDCLPGPQECITVTIPSPGGTGLWTWEGTYSIDWFNPCNWDKKTVPTSTADVLIPGATTYQPTISGANAHCNTIEVNSANGAIVNINTASATLEVHY